MNLLESKLVDMAQENDNPYLGLDAAQLQAAAARRAAELAPGGPKRTAEQRAWIAADTRHLLLALAAAPASEPELPDPSLIPGATAFLQTQAARLDQAQRDQRLAALDIASDEWLGAAGMVPWYRWHFVGGQPLMEVAMASDEGLMTALRLLVAKPRGRRR